MNPFTLKGKNILITGGSKGIGYATADLCLSLGANVTIVARDKHAINIAISKLKHHDGNCCSIIGDLTNQNEIETVIAQYQLINGNTLDCLINCVGRVIAKPTIDFNTTDFDSIIDTNIRSTFLLCQNAFPILKNSGSSSIVTISSENALKATPEKVLEGASRAAVIHITKSLALEWAQFNIRVNSVPQDLLIQAG